MIFLFASLIITLIFFNSASTITLLVSRKGVLGRYHCFLLQTRSNMLTLYGDVQALELMGLACLTNIQSIKVNRVICIVLLLSSLGRIFSWIKSWYVYCGKVFYESFDFQTHYFEDPEVLISKRGAELKRIPASDSKVFGLMERNKLYIILG